MVEFGPDGLTFAAPATLTISLSEPPSEGFEAVVALDVDAEWVPQADSSVANLTVSAPVSRFSTYTVIFVAGEPVVSSDYPAAVTPCGGDLTGRLGHRGTVHSGLPPGR